MKVEKYKQKNWALYSETGELICVCLYKKGAMNIMNLLSILEKKDLERSIQHD